MTELVADPDGCEEASTFSHLFFIPCNAPANRLIYSPRDDRVYRMCSRCAEHSVRDRNMRDVGSYPADLQKVAEL